jgi:hypothetical protein
MHKIVDGVFGFLDLLNNLLSGQLDVLDVER